MLKKYIVNLFILTIYIASCLLIYNQKPNYNDNITNTSTSINYNLLNSKNIINTNKKIENSSIIGTLKIDKINLEKNFYSIDSPENNVEQNIALLKKDENLIVLAAHSGTGPLAFFNQLDKLKIEDEINLTYSNQNYTYKITKIEEQDKDGTIEIEKNSKKRLILTTCSQKNENNQLVIISEMLIQKKEG